jgi:hypothetical protein
VTPVIALILAAVSGLVDEFIEKVFILAAYQNGATIGGFNLPFDLPRIAMDYQRARAVVRRNGRVDRTMVGGFSFKLSD